jgi:hypothetical protein
MKLPEPPRYHQFGKPLRQVLHETPLVVCFIIIFFQFFCFINPVHSIQESVQEPTPAKEDVQLREQWGIEIASLRLTAAGHMVDFRYRVIDQIKALPLFDRKRRPVLIDQVSGMKLNVPVAPKIGSLRQKTMKPEVGRIYFILFGNPGIVQEGSKVTLVIGDVKIENLTVEGELQTRTQQHN